MRRPDHAFAVLGQGLAAFEGIDRNLGVEGHFNPPLSRRRQHPQEMAGKIHVAPPAIVTGILARGGLEYHGHRLDMHRADQRRSEEGLEKRALERQDPDRIRACSLGEEQQPVPGMKTVLENLLLLLRHQP